jgi:hypothetical protein
MKAIIDALVSSAALASHLGETCKCETTKAMVSDLRGKLDAAYDQACEINEKIKEFSVFEGR